MYTCTHVHMYTCTHVHVVHVLLDTGDTGQFTEQIEGVFQLPAPAELAVYIFYMSSFVKGV